MSFMKMSLVRAVDTAKVAASQLGMISTTGCPKVSVMVWTANTLLIFHCIKESLNHVNEGECHFF